MAQLVNGECQILRNYKKLVTVQQFIAGSSNGRTLDSGSSNLGSSPSPAAYDKGSPCIARGAFCHTAELGRESRKRPKAAFWPKRGGVEST